MNEGSGYIKLNVAAMGVFMDDGTLDKAELDRLIRIAMQDGTIDPDEKRVLGRIFGQIQPADVSAEVLGRIIEIKRRHGIDNISSEP